MIIITVTIIHPENGRSPWHCVICFYYILFICENLHFTFFSYIFILFAALCSHQYKSQQVCIMPECGSSSYFIQTMLHGNNKDRTRTLSDQKMWCKVVRRVCIYLRRQDQWISRYLDEWIKTIISFTVWLEYGWPLWNIIEPIKNAF